MTKISTYPIYIWSVRGLIFMWEAKRFASQFCLPVLINIHEPSAALSLIGRLSSAHTARRTTSLSRAHWGVHPYSAIRSQPQCWEECVCVLYDSQYTLPPPLFSLSVFHTITHRVDQAVRLAASQSGLSVHPLPSPCQGEGVLPPAAVSVVRKGGAHPPVPQSILSTPSFCSVWLPPASHPPSSFFKKILISPFSLPLINSHFIRSFFPTSFSTLYLNDRHNWLPNHKQDAHKTR